MEPYHRSLLELFKDPSIRNPTVIMKASTIGAGSLGVLGPVSALQVCLAHTWSSDRVQARKWAATPEQRVYCRV